MYCRRHRTRNSEVPVLQLDDEVVDMTLFTSRTRIPNKKLTPTSKLGTHGVQSMGRQKNSKDIPPTELGVISL